MSILFNYMTMMRILKLTVHDAQMSYMLHFHTRDGKAVYLFRLGTSFHFHDLRLRHE